MHFVIKYLIRILLIIYVTPNKFDCVFIPSPKLVTIINLELSNAFFPGFSEIDFYFNFRASFVLLRVYV